jgi:hypothetical protein
MKLFANTLWEDAKPAGEFVAGIAAIVGVLCGLSWMGDDIFVHIHVDHRWWVYRAWHAWWWVIVPLVMVGIGWPFRRRALGGGLWAVGAVWMIFIGWAAGMLLFINLFYHVSQRVGFLGGSVLSCVSVLLLGLGYVAVGRLVNHLRSRASR